MLLLLFQILNAVIYDLDLFLDHRHSPCEIVVLCDPLFKLLQAVRRQLAAHEDTAKRAADIRSQFVPALDELSVKTFVTLSGFYDRQP